METMFTPRLSSLNKRRHSQYGLLATAAGVSVMSAPDGRQKFHTTVLVLKIAGVELNFGHSWSEPLNMLHEFAGCFFSFPTGSRVHVEPAKRELCPLWVQISDGWMNYKGLPRKDDRGGRTGTGSNHRHVSQSQWAFYVCWQLPVTSGDVSSHGCRLTIVTLLICTSTWERRS